MGADKVTPAVLLDKDLYERPLPVAFPRVAHVSVMNAVFVRLLIQEVEHVFDGEGQSAPSMNRAEQRLKEIVHKLL